MISEVLLIRAANQLAPNKTQFPIALRDLRASAFPQPQGHLQAPVELSYRGPPAWLATDLLNFVVTDARSPCPRRFQVHRVLNTEDWRKDAGNPELMSCWGEQNTIVS